MKRTIKIWLLVIVSVLILVACKKQTPSDAADTFFKGIKNKDTETISSVFAGDVSDWISQGGNLMNDSDLPDSVTKQLDEKIFGFDYDVIEETVDGENATVKVNITAFPIGEAVIEWFREYISTRLSMAFSGASEEEMNAYLESSFTEKLAALEEKSYESTITLSMYQTNGKWMIDESSLDSKFIDRVSDGLFSSITAMSNAFSE